MVIPESYLRARIKPRGGSLRCAVRMSKHRVRILAESQACMFLPPHRPTAQLTSARFGVDKIGETSRISCLYVLLLPHRLTAQLASARFSVDGKSCRIIAPGLSPVQWSKQRKE